MAMASTKLLALGRVAKNIGIGAVAGGLAGKLSGDAQNSEKGTRLGLKVGAVVGAVASIPAGGTARTVYKTGKVFVRGIKASPRYQDAVRKIRIHTRAGWRIITLKGKK